MDYDISGIGQHHFGYVNNPTILLRKAQDLVDNEVININKSDFIFIFIINMDNTSNINPHNLKNIQNLITVLKKA